MKTDMLNYITTHLWLLNTVSIVGTIGFLMGIQYAVYYWDGLLKWVKK